MSDLQTIVAEFKKIKELRLKLEKTAKELKEGKEADLQAQILQHLVENNIQSVKFPGVGNVVRVTRTHYEIEDKEAFALAVYNSLDDAIKHHRPLTDAMLAQFRVSKDQFTVYTEEDNVTADALGVNIVDKLELLIRKA